ncbi:Transglycosylase-like domain-containing protein [Saccharopolyspora antimicrobica]|uniref:Transglycosylase-like domain-containing protein n=1 Tax=Saccharopolyspora antimicrobica TaxID=455193 RepID=A0A1I5EU14_9PSEU|nr:transglycosylase-like protein with SLT domain [Saccharopolyspora antimicrobica]SFO15018.1 Transglycosylase-like domain-containing protein [Saccharopolyspora antimicrobica]
MRFGNFAKTTAAAAIVLSGAVSAAAVSPGTAQAAGVWDRLAKCESGGNWSINTGNGYYGGLQFSRATWASYGGERFHRYPHRATREQQIAIAEVLRAANGGFGAWPACARKLGLPR